MFINTPVLPTLVAKISGSTPSAVAVIRLSGPKAWPIARQMFRSRAATHELHPGLVSVGWFVDPAMVQEIPWSFDKLSPAVLDEGILLCFKGPNSFTGDDVIEFHCHGGSFIVRMLLEWCIRLGAEPAGPGEFSKRALFNGKLDLTQAESIMDLIHSQGVLMTKAAVQNLRHRSVAQRIEHIVATLTHLQAGIVASVDFPEEVDEPDREPMQNRLRVLLEEVQHLIDSGVRSQSLRDGLKVALLGLPNSGKSSLFNALLSADRAIVSDIAGTTRDVLSESLMIEGVAVTLLDTAGIRETDNQIELLGIERTWQAATDATGILYLFDASVGLLREDRRLLNALRAKLPDAAILLIANKIDTAEPATTYPDDFYTLSATTGEGITRLIKWLGLLVQTKVPFVAQQQDALLCLNHRQMTCLQQLHAQAAMALEAISTAATPLDVASFPLTMALKSSDQLLGKDTTENVLDAVFSQFCVGK
jgi:tRNA modification GTPase